jgi:hypothetical protein
MMLSAEGPSWIFCILRVLADILCLNHNVRFTLKADMCSATWHVRFVPIADISGVRTFVLGRSEASVWFSIAAGSKGLVIFCRKTHQQEGKNERSSEAGRNPKG